MLAAKARPRQDCTRFGRLGVWPGQMTPITPDAEKREPEASSVPAVSPATRPFQRYLDTISRGSSDIVKQSITI